MGLLSRIKWIKNIKREEGNDWAYFENADKDDFILAFAPEHAGGASKPLLGDVIVLFQTVNETDHFSGGTFLTHLVLVDSLNVESTNRKDYPIGRHVIVLAKTSPNEALKSDKILMSFRDVNSGQLCDIDLFNKPHKDLNKRRLLDLFQPYW